METDKFRRWDKSYDKNVSDKNDNENICAVMRCSENKILTDICHSLLPPSISVITLHEYSKYVIFKLMYVDKQKLVYSPVD